MKAQRINLVTPVRKALIESGYSTVKIVSAVNQELAKAKLVSETAKTGDGTASKDGYRVTVTGTFKYEHSKTLPVLFDAWHSAIGKADKIARFESVEIPPVFSKWLEFAKATKEETEAENKALALELSGELK